MEKHNLSFADYQALEAVNWSNLKEISHSPAHYQTHLLEPRKQTEEMLTGSALHCLVLEGEASYLARYAAAPKCDRRKKEGRAVYDAFIEANPDKEILTPEQDALARDMAASILSHPTAARLLALCPEREATLQWEDPATGVPCKGRPDALSAAQGLVLDLKTAKDAGPRGFARAAADLQYHGQAAFYLTGLAAGGIEADFVFLAVEKAPPFAVGIYHIGGEELAAGRQLVARYLDLYARCADAGEWPGYFADVQPLALPRWALS